MKRRLLLSMIGISLCVPAACGGPEVPEQSTSAGSAGAAGTSGAGGATAGAGGATAGAGGAGAAGTAGASGAAGTGGSDGAGAGGTGAGAGGAGAGAGGTGAGAGGAGAAGSAGSTSGSAGSAGLSGNAGAGGAGSAGSAGTGGGGAIQDVACDFSKAGTDCITCGGASCIDTGSDTKHCGACNHECATGVPCENGVCGPTIVAAMGGYTPGVLLGGRVFAWGSNEYQGAWGAANGPPAVYTPREVTALGSNLARAVTGDATCGVTPQGEVRCFGMNHHGQLGTGQVDGPAICGPAKGGWCNPTPQKAAIDNVTELREGVMWCGGTHLCARRADRSVSCWGDFGACDQGNAAVAAPLPVELPPSAGIAVLGGSSCSRSCTGRVQCWGSNAHYELGVTSPSTPVPVGIPNLRVTSLVSGYCGIREDRTVVCWGPSGLGQAGTIGDTLPVTVAGVSDVVQVAAGGAVCALTGAGQVWCWGAKYGIGGVGACTGDACPTPTKVAIDGVVELGSSSGTMMARLANGTYKAWGINGIGQIGNGGIADSLTPTPVKNLPPP